MSLKAKLVSTVAAFVMVLALMVVGVLAATNPTVNMGGSITFTATDVAATIKITSTGASTNLNQTVTLDSTTEGNVTTHDADLDVDFADKDTAIVITVTITNDSEDAMTVTLPEPALSGTSAGNVDIATDMTAGGEYTAGVAVTVNGGAVATYTITLTLTDKASTIKDGAAAWAADFTLARASV